MPDSLASVNDEEKSTLYFRLGFGFCTDDAVVLVLWRSSLYLDDCLVEEARFQKRLKYIEHTVTATILHDLD